MLKVPIINISTILLISFFWTAATMPSFAQERGHKKTRISPNAAVSQTIGTTKITITYGRPGVKGRKIFGGLVPYNKVWRTGANESTVIVFPKNVTIEGNHLKAGTYSLYTIPGKNQWTVIINSKLSWGTQYDQSKDVLRVQVTPKQTVTTMQQLLIYFQNITDHSADIVIWWDKTKVPFSIKL